MAQTSTMVYVLSHHINNILLFWFGRTIYLLPILNCYEMKSFLFSLIKYSFFLLLIVLIAFWGTKRMVSNYFDYSIPAEKNILILGDSHTQTSLNDTILKNAVNLSESADTYFYSYIKLKHLISKNKQIDTLILAYSYSNITKSQDDWLINTQVNAVKLPKYFFMFDNNDLTASLKMNHHLVLNNTLQIIASNVRLFSKIRQKNEINQLGIGGYLPLTNIYKSKPKKYIKTELKYGQFDLEYLYKIYSLCTKNKIKVILLNAPTIFDQNHVNPYKSKYNSIARKKLKTATIINLSNLKLQSKYFADEDHLNEQGARLFSNKITEIFKRKN